MTLLKVLSKTGLTLAIAGSIALAGLQPGEACNRQPQLDTFCSLALNTF
ncbi:hypothetical protein [Bacillus sp. CGMCC 1.16607]